MNNPIAEGLAGTEAGLAYTIHCAVERAYGERPVLYTRDHDFDVPQFARAKRCEAHPRDGFLAQYEFRWHDGIHASPIVTLLDVTWEEQRFEVLIAEWGTGTCRNGHAWLVGPDAESVRRFFAAVCAWCGDVHGEILVYEGYWRKSGDLYDSIRGASFDDLVTAPGLAEALRTDAERFFASKELYARCRVPWKRGLLLVGPPGNGKTHALKALVNTLGQRCLYVTSIAGRDEFEEHHHIRAVFARAREARPCVLVLEDIDALVTGQNRSAFLNELDGFASNDGILVIATSNHPERLDPALANRPSRFDRKILFDLPAHAERVRYLARGNRALGDEVRLPDDDVARLADATEGYSFAYLKELLLSATLRWAGEPTRRFADIALETAVTLRASMTPEDAEPEPAPRRRRRGVVPPVE